VSGTRTDQLPPAREERCRERCAAEHDLGHAGVLEVVVTFRCTGECVLLGITAIARKQARLWISTAQEQDLLARQLEVFAQRGAAAANNVGAGAHQLLVSDAPRSDPRWQARGCADCGRRHDRGFAMHYCAAKVDGRLVRAWFCASGCHAPVEPEIPGGICPPCRIVAGEHETGRAGWSEAVSMGQGHGTGTR